MRLVLVAGNTATARIDGISAAGADPEVMAHTPAADLEVVTYGAPVRAPAVPVSPTGCPTPAVVTRAARELLDVDVLPVDAGLARPTAAPTLDLGGDPGGDVREPEPVPNAGETFRAARRVGRGLPDDELLVGETIPGGTTTALGTLAALGERTAVSSSLPDNPLALKRSTVRDGLAASDVAEGELAGEPVAAVRRMGDPVLAAVAGLVVGATGAGTDVTLAGGTQLAAAAALARHAGADGPLSLATTAFVARDDAAPMAGFAADLDLDLTVTDPRFERGDHPALDGFVAGEAKEGVGMGGALALADGADASMAALRERIVAVYDRLGLGAPEAGAVGSAGEP